MITKQMEAFINYLNKKVFKVLVVSETKFIKRFGTITADKFEYFKKQMKKLNIKFVWEFDNNYITFYK